MSGSPFAQVGPRLIALGYAAIPLAPGEKKPHPRLTKWAERYVKILPTQAEQELWCSWPDCGVGVVCGPASGDLCGIDADVDDPTILQAIAGALPPVQVAKRGAKGKTMFFRAPGLQKSTSIQGLVDVLGPGRQTVLPPSRHPSGVEYEWLTVDTLLDTPPQELPALEDKHAKALVEALQPYMRKKPRDERRRATPTDGEPTKRKWDAAVPTLKERNHAAAIVGKMREEIAKRPEGDRNQFLNYCAWGAGVLVGLGWIDRKSVEDILTEAARESGLADREITPTLNSGLEAGIRKGMNGERRAIGGGCLDDLQCYIESGKYIWTPTMALWPRHMVDSIVGKVPIMEDDGITPRLDEKGKPIIHDASYWLEQHRPINQMTWFPGMPEIVEGQVLDAGGGEWIKKDGARTLNLYRAPEIKPGDPKLATPWIDHVRLIYPDNADHIINCFAHRIQKPAEKIAHGIVLVGQQGIGKDSIVEPLRQGVGERNCIDVYPRDLLDKFTPHVRSVVLRIKEARDMGESGVVSRYGLYEACKDLLANSPRTLVCHEKFKPPYPVPNLCFCIFTSNARNALYIPAGDRRHYIATSKVARSPEMTERCRALWQFYKDGGFAHVVLYLALHDISEFDASVPPPETEAFHDMVMASRSPEANDLADVLDRIGKPKAVTMARIMVELGEYDELLSWLKKNQRQHASRMEDNGYVIFRNPDDPKTGRWRLSGVRHTVYVLASLTDVEARRAVDDLRH